MTGFFLLAAATLLSFNDGWEVRCEGETDWTRVTVPHDAAFDRGYDREEDPDQGFMRCPKTVYRKTFARLQEKGRFAVRFDGVYMNSSVALNGRKVGGRVNGFLPFEVPLDGLGETNVIEVACDAVTPDFASDGLHFFRIDAVDVRGNRVLSCEDEVEVSVSGGTLLALDNGSPRDHTTFGCARRRLFRGSLVAVVKASSQEVRPSISVVLK